MSDKNQSPPYDRLDIAFIAIGAADAFEEADGANKERFEGQIAFIEECVNHAELLHRIWLEQNGEWAGVWAYDVAERFGYLYGLHILGGGLLTDAEKILREIVDAA